MEPLSNYKLSLKIQETVSFNAAVSAAYSALLSSSYFERINDDDDDDE